MKTTNKILLTMLYVSLAASLLMTILFESDAIAPGIFASYGADEFITATIVEMITICTIPVALRTFKFGFVRRSVKNNGISSLRAWSIGRLASLCLLMVANTLLYYLFMNVAFGYMGIICFLCIFLIYPTEERLKKETEECSR